MKKTILTLLLLTIIMSQALFANEDRYAELKKRLTDYIEQEMKKQKIAGISLALVDENDIAWTKGFGYADVKAKVPVDEQTVFSLASISKVFTGLAVMTLVEEGKIDLDSPLSTYISEFSIKSRFPEDEIFTIRDMLTHHSGLPSDIHYSGIEKFSPASVELNDNHEEMLLEYLKTVHIPYRPGYVHAYSNVAYDLLALVVERVSGMEFNDYVTEHIFRPSGMSQASFIDLFNRTELGEAMAMPHNKRNAAEKMHYIGTGSGALNASSADMGNFIKMLLAKGSFGENHILKEESLEEMWTVQNEDVALDREKMGLSFFLEQEELNYAGRFYGHGGNLSYYHSSLKVLPDHGLGVLVTTNSASGMEFVHKVATKLLQESLKEKKGIVPPADQLKQPVVVELDAEERAKVKALYASALAGPMAIEEKRGKLFVKIMGIKIRLEPLSDGWLRAKTAIPFFKNMQLQIEPIEGKRRVYVRIGPYSFLLGEEYEKQELDYALWEGRLGSYTVLVPGTGEAKKGAKSFTISYDDGQLIMDAGKEGTKLLTIVGDNECVVAGAGRGANETVYFIDTPGQPNLKWSGYELKLK